VVAVVVVFLDENIDERKPPIFVVQNDDGLIMD
jgi:hypothetical protein